jgi:hypothetical protein
MSERIYIDHGDLTLNIIKYSKHSLEISLYGDGKYKNNLIGKDKFFDLMDKLIDGRLATTKKEILQKTFDEIDQWSESIETEEFEGCPQYDDVVSVSKVYEIFQKYMEEYS